MVNLSKEELEFLVELQHEMLTQDHVCQAAPRFWVVENKRTVPTAEDYADGYEIFDDNGCDTVAHSMEGFIKYVNDKYMQYGLKVFYNNGDAIIFTAGRSLDEDDTLEVLTEEYENEDDRDIIDMNDYCTLETLIEEVNSFPYVYEQYRLVHTRDEWFIEPNTMFLTNRGAKRHIEANYYHYNKEAHPYAMTAWRSPEVDKLWKILDKINWKELIEEKYGIQSGEVCGLHPAEGNDKETGYNASSECNV